jgi:hypothetical protein
LLKRDESDEAEGEHVKPCCRKNNESGDKDLLEDLKRRKGKMHWGGRKDSLQWI